MGAISDDQCRSDEHHQVVLEEEQRPEVTAQRVEEHNELVVQGQKREDCVFREVLEPLVEYLVELNSGVVHLVSGFLAFREQSQF